MRTCLLTALALTTALVGAATAADSKPAARETGVAHLVYFTLTDNSPAAQKTLVDACAKYLSKHKGIVSFSAGVRATEIKGEVNDSNYDVTLNIVFDTKANQDAYQNAPDHKTFIEENKANWKTVRVFDFAYHGGKQPEAKAGTEARLAHAVFFTLADKTPEGQAKFVEAVNALNMPTPASYRFFTTGERITTLDRDVNDKEFEVGLLIVFADRKSLDEYVAADYHKKFVEANKTKWKSVRVFDSTLQK